MAVIVYRPCDLDERAALRGARRLDDLFGFVREAVVPEARYGLARHPRPQHQHRVVAAVEEEVAERSVEAVERARAQQLHIARHRERSPREATRFEPGEVLLPITLEELRCVDPQHAHRLLLSRAPGDLGGVPVHDADVARVDAQAHPMIAPGGTTMGFGLGRPRRKRERHHQP